MDAAKLDELKAARMPRLYWRTILAPEWDETTEEGRAWVAALDAYFVHFVRFGKCVACGEHLTGLFGSFRWGLANGEGECGACGYPARGIHRNVGPIKSLHLALQYHPDELAISADPESESLGVEG